MPAEDFNLNIQIPDPPFSKLIDERSGNGTSYIGQYIFLVVRVLQYKNLLMFMAFLYDHGLFIEVVCFIALGLIFHYQLITAQEDYGPVINPTSVRLEILSLPPVSGE